MLIKADTIKDLNEKLRQHPAIKGSLREHVQPEAKTSGDSPEHLRRLIRETMASDARIAALVTSTRRVTACRKEGRALLRNSTKREVAAGRKARDFSARWAGIEDDYRSMVEGSYELVSANKSMSTIAQVAKDVDDVHRFANPVFLEKSDLLLLGELGGEVEDLRDAYRFAYLPGRKQVDHTISKMGRRIPTEGREHIDSMVFLYAPERMVESGLLALVGAWSYISIAAAVVSAYMGYLAYLEELKQTARMNLILFCVLVWIIIDTNNKLAEAQAHLAQLELQYADEIRVTQAVPEAATSVDTPASVALEFGYTIGNMSRSKREVHLPNCSFLHLIRPDHMRTFVTIEAARASGLDNCAHCIGGSTR